ncbi:MAG: MarR family transcriptional regulator [Pseudomonadota bacterium]
MKTLAHLTDLGLTQWRILAVIHMEGQTVAAKVARYADLDKGQISRAVNTLKDMGFVQEGDDPNDGRSAMLSLTEAGHAEYDHVVQTMRKRQKMLVQDVTAEDLETFRAVLKKIEARAQESIL